MKEKLNDDRNSIDTARFIKNKQDEDEIHTELYTYRKEDRDSGIAISQHFVRINRETAVILEEGVNHTQCFRGDIDECIKIWSDITETYGEPDEVEEAIFTNEFGLIDVKTMSE